MPPTPWTGIRDILDGTVQPALFTIACTTCHVRLAVRSPEVVGAILECPKCGCLVTVTPPEGWQPPKPPETPVAESAITSNGKTAGAPVLQSENAHAATAGDSTPGGAAPDMKGTHPRLWHKWPIMAAGPIIAAGIGLVVWLTMFSGLAPDYSTGPAAARPDDKSDRTPADKQEAKPAEENSHSAESRPDAEPPQTQMPEPKDNTADNKTGETKSAETKSAESATPEGKPAEVKKPENAAAAEEEKNPPAEAKSTQTRQNQEPVTAAEASKLVKLVPPEQIDAQSRLGEVIPALEFRNMPFARAISMLGGLSGLPITIDPDAAARLQVSLRDPIAIRMKGATLEEILQEIVAQRGMAFSAEDGQVIVTGPAEQGEKLRRIRYTVSDLADNDQATSDRLATLVQTLIYPQSWQAAGGEGTIETDKTAINVTHNSAAHEQILVFCEKLRKARGLALKSKRDPKQFDLTTRLQQADAALRRPVSANFHEPTALVDILAYLGRQAEIDVLLDRQALGKIGMSDKSEISFAVGDCPLAAALKDLLGPLKLGYRPIDADTLQVTTQAALDARLDLEFYQVGILLGQNLSGSDLIGQIKAAVSPESWTAPGRSAAIYFDRPSAALLVLQSPPAHGQIQAFLNKIAENQK
jgi:hypothetical protein